MPFTPSLAPPIFIVPGLFGDNGALGVFGEDGVAGLFGDDGALGVFGDDGVLGLFGVTGDLRQYTYYKRSAAYACCLHQVSLRTPLKKGRCSRTPRNSWSRRSQGRLTNTTITIPPRHTQPLLLLLCFTDSFGLPLKEMLFRKGLEVSILVVLRFASSGDVTDLYLVLPSCNVPLWN